MTDGPEHQERAATPSSRSASNLDDHTIESLSDYLDRGRVPRDESIEASPSAQNALAALSRLRAVAPRIIASEAAKHTGTHDPWIKRVLDHIGVQAHAGRDIPISSDQSGASLSISEGAVRAVIREVGDQIDGILVERCRLDGDIETADAPVSITIEVSTFEGAVTSEVTALLRSGVEDALRTHTELRVEDVTVTVRESGLTED